jgi:hypothetical protein
MRFRADKNKVLGELLARSRWLPAFARPPSEQRSLSVSGQIQRSQGAHRVQGATRQAPPSPEVEEPFKNSNSRNEKQTISYSGVRVGIQKTARAPAKNQSAQGVNIGSATTLGLIQSNTPFITSFA